MASPARANRDDEADQTIARAQRSLDADNLAEARRLIHTVTARRSFSRLTPKNQQAAILLLARIDARDPGCEVALPPAHAATQAANAGERSWAALLAQLYACDDYANAASTLTTVIARYPNVAAGLDPSEVFRLTPYLNDLSALRFLLGSDWIHDETLDLSFIRLRLIRRLLAQDQTSEAIVAARDLAANGRTDLGSIVEFLSDRTFDPVVAAAPEVFSFAAMSDRQLANSIADATESPERLSLVNALAQNLWDRGRFDEAEAVTNDALARVREGTSRRPTFVDQRESLNWTLEMRARILAALGRTDDALDSMRQAAEEPEGDRVNVSQTLNRVGMLLATGRAEDALAALNQFDLRRGSPYGRAVARSLRVCVLAELGDGPAMRSALDDLVAHKHDSLLQVRAAAFCANDLNLAARTFLEQLDHPSERRSALISIQRYPNSDPSRGELGEVLSRPEIVAAIEREAHVQAFPILHPF